MAMEMRLPSLYSLLALQIEAGIDEALDELPQNWLEGDIQEKIEKSDRGPIRHTEKDKYPGVPRAEGVHAPPMPKKENPIHQEAQQSARMARSIEELEAMVRGFEGCTLKKTATTTVFADGNPKADLMILGEAPGAEEDRQGKPFVGPAGRLLDLMMGAIGLDRQSYYITNVCFWRPPGNRKPSEAEWAACRPFVIRHIELVRPKFLLLLGGSAAQQVLNKQEGITRLRGRWFDLGLGTNEIIPALPTFHPAYLLRQPAAKKEAWQDILSLKKKLYT